MSCAVRILFPAVGDQEPAQMDVARLGQTELRGGGADTPGDLGHWLGSVVEGVHGLQDAGVVAGGDLDHVP